jgi:hypothetical protein
MQERNPPILERNRGLSAVGQNIHVSKKWHCLLWQFLQKQKRAKIVGEVTGGGAHPVQAFVLDNGFVANVPYARAINPITKSDWESIGVKPDNLTSADHALDTVLKMIKHN